MNIFKLFINYLLIKGDTIKQCNYRIIKNKFLLNYNASIQNYPIEFLFSTVID
jgi:hypothetical protein